jgi:hypothetical protein
MTAGHGGEGFETGPFGRNYTTRAAVDTVDTRQVVLENGLHRVAVTLPRAIAGAL